MTKEELASLAPVFLPKEKRLDGKRVDWDRADYRTFYWLKVVREFLGLPVIVIREWHEDRPRWAGAVDWCCPGVPYGQAVLASLRLPGASLGFYSGASTHVDFRDYDEGRGELPARWWAVRPSEYGILQARGLDKLVATRTTEWVYLSARHELGWEALRLVIDLAEGKK